MNAFDEDAFDVGGFGGAGDPDDVGVGGLRGDGGRDVGKDLIAADGGDVDPRCEGAEAAGRGVVGEDDRAGFGDGAEGGGEAELIIVDAGAIEFGGDREGGREVGREGGVEGGIAVAAEEIVFGEEGDERERGGEWGAVDGAEAFGERRPEIVGCS